MRNARNLAKRYTIEFFRKKSDYLQDQFLGESSQLYANYEALRQRYFTREKKFAAIAVTAQKQERTINELKTFIKRHLKRIFEVIERRYDETLQKTLNLLPGQM